MAPIDDAFNALFFGSGAILGFILILVFCVLIATRWRWGAIFSALIEFVQAIALSAANLTVNGGGLGWYILASWLAFGFFIIAFIEELRSGSVGF